MWMLPPYLPSDTGDLSFHLFYIIKDTLYLSCDVLYFGKCQPSFSIQSSTSCPKCAHTFYQASTPTSRSISSDSLTTFPNAYLSMILMFHIVGSCRHDGASLRFSANLDVRWKKGVPRPFPQKVRQTDNTLFLLQKTNKKIANKRHIRFTTRTTNLSHFSSRFPILLVTFFHFSSFFYIYNFDYLHHVFIYFVDTFICTLGH
jgi:hypothetical protein